LTLISFQTSKPSIECAQCEEEALSLERDNYGYAVLSIMLFFPLLYILVRVIKRYQKDRYAHFLELASRRMDSMRAESHRGKKHERLKRIKPQLEIIAGRLRAKQQEQDFLESKGSGEGDTSNSIEIVNSKRPKESVHVDTDGAVTFDAKQLFDDLDTAPTDGTLSYTELNAILELDHLQLIEFVRRMNKLEGVSPNCSVVSRRTFLRHFVDVLAESSNFKPNKAEAERLFDEIAKQGTNKYGAVEPGKFYTSSLSNFLSDSQINNLLVRLRSRQSAGPPDSHLDSVRGLSGDGGRDKNRAIRRDTFVAHYPELLMEIAIDPDQMPMLSTIRDGGTNSELPMGVDITFENLSLSISMGEFSINVVDKVTGRLRAGTMVSTWMVGFVGDKIGFASHLTIPCPLLQNRQL
jgi:hypothetical protein